MFREIKIGEKNVPMLAMASAVVYYKRVFGKDAIATQYEMADKDLTGEMLSFYAEMGFIMAKMAEANGDRAKLLALNYESYIEWLDQFETRDYHGAIPSIMALYEGQNAPDSKAKNG